MVTRKPLEYRRRQPSDDAFILNTAMKEMGEVFQASTGMPLTPEMVRQQILGNDTTCVVYREGKPIGYYSYTVFQDGRMYVSAVVLAAAYQGRGHGRRIVRHLEAEAAKRGARLAELHVQVRNSKAIGFWLRQGYGIRDTSMPGSLHMTKPMGMEALAPRPAPRASATTVSRRRKSSAR